MNRLFTTSDYNLLHGCCVRPDVPVSWTSVLFLSLCFVYVLKVVLVQHNKRRDSSREVVITCQCHITASG